MDDLLVPAFSNAAMTLEIGSHGDRDMDEVWDAVDVHCRARTQFGEVLSAPFRVVQTSK